MSRGVTVRSIHELRIGALLRLNHQEVSKRINQMLEETGYGDIRSTYFPVIQPLGLRPEGLTITELARMAGITKQGMGQLVTYVEQHGYVEKQRDPGDGRAWLVKLTEKGVEMLEQLYNIVTNLDEEFKQMTGTEEFLQLRSLLIHLYSMLLEGTGNKNGG